MISYPLHTKKKYYNVHRDSIDITFRVNISLLHNKWYQSPFYTSLIAYHKLNTEKFLKKLASFNIATLLKLQDPTSTRILTLNEFSLKFHTKSRLIKNVLQHAATVFPPTTYYTPTNTQHTLPCTPLPQNLDIPHCPPPNNNN